MIKYFSFVLTMLHNFIHLKIKLSFNKSDDKANWLMAVL